MSIFGNYFLQAIIDAGFSEVMLHESVLSVHKNKPVEKPEDCSICCESLDNQPDPLNCGHWVHDHCLAVSIKHGNYTCPLCRAPVIQHPRVIKKWLENQLDADPQLKMIMSLVLTLVYGLIYVCGKI